jgi:hypothetical protein
VHFLALILFVPCICEFRSVLEKGVITHNGAWT